MIWHNLKETPNDLPKITGWYAVKIKSSNDLSIVYGYEKIDAKYYDAWSKIECPY